MDFRFQILDFGFGEHAMRQRHGTPPAELLVKHCRNRASPDRPVGVVFFTSRWEWVVKKTQRSKSQVPGGAADVRRTKSDLPGGAADVRRTKAELPGGVADVRRTKSELPGGVADIRRTKSELPGGAADVRRSESELPGGPEPIRRIGPIRPIAS